MDKILWSAITFILGVLLRTVSPLFVDTVQLRAVAFVAKRKWPFFSNHRMGGEWEHIWYARDSDYWPNENKCKVTLNAIGKHFAGVWIYDHKSWLVTGSLGKDHVITGTWRALEYDGYHGNWIGKVDLNGDTIVGWYLGTSKRPPGIGAGEWYWWRKGKQPPSMPAAIVQHAKRGPQSDASLQ